MFVVLSVCLSVSACAFLASWLLAVLMASFNLAAQMQPIDEDLLWSSPAAWMNCAGLAMAICSRRYVGMLLPANGKQKHGSSNAKPAVAMPLAAIAPHEACGYGAHEGPGHEQAPAMVGDWTARGFLNAFSRAVQRRTGGGSW